MMVFMPHAVTDYIYKYLSIKTAQYKVHSHQYNRLHTADPHNTSIITGHTNSADAPNKSEMYIPARPSSVFRTPHCDLHTRGHIHYCWTLECARVQ